MFNLVSTKFLNVIEQHSNGIMNCWLERMKSDPATAVFLNENMVFVKSKAQSMMENMFYWISNDISKEELGKIFSEEGRLMFCREIPLCEVVRAMETGRRTLIEYVESETSSESALHLHQMGEFNVRVTLFFDRAIYFIIRGYNDELRSRLFNSDTHQVEKGSIFFEEGFYN